MLWRSGSSAEQGSKKTIDAHSNLQVPNYEAR
jgi:hypothetical protein